MVGSAPAIPLYVYQNHHNRRLLGQAPITNSPTCPACGACEERCPFGVEVIQNMEKAAALFGV